MQNMVQSPPQNLGFAITFFGAKIVGFQTSSLHFHIPTLSVSVKILFRDYKLETFKSSEQITRWACHYFIRHKRKLW
jgi:hypothetical protein